jgi:carbohydrate-binding DOMON domain-containing protein
MVTTLNLDNFEEPSNKPILIQTSSKNSLKNAVFKQSTTETQKTTTTETQTTPTVQTVTTETKVVEKNSASMIKLGVSAFLLSLLVF